MPVLRLLLTLTAGSIVSFSHAQAVDSLEGFGKVHLGMTNDQVEKMLTKRYTVTRFGVMDGGIPMSIRLECGKDRDDMMSIAGYQFQTLVLNFTNEGLGTITLSNPCVPDTSDIVTKIKRHFETMLGPSQTFDLHGSMVHKWHGEQREMIISHHDRHSANPFQSYGVTLRFIPHLLAIDRLLGWENIRLGMSRDDVIEALNRHNRWELLTEEQAIVALPKHEDPLEEIQWERMMINLDGDSVVQISMERAKAIAEAMPEGLAGRLARRYGPALYQRGEFEAINEWRGKNAMLSVDYRWPDNTHVLKLVLTYRSKPMERR